MASPATKLEFPEHESRVIRARAPANGPWYVLRHRTEPRTVAHMLEDFVAEGFEAYLPQLLRRRRVMVAGKRETRPQWVPEPLFRGYVFVRPSYCQRLDAKPMTRVYGVEGMKPIGAVISAAIERIRGKEVHVDGLVGWVTQADMEYVPIEEWRLSLAPGDEVEFDNFGIFMRGVVEANDKGRLMLLADAMGRSAQFTVDLPRTVRPVEGGHL